MNDRLRMQTIPQLEAHLQFFAQHFVTHDHEIRDYIEEWAMSLTCSISTSCDHNLP